ncbi:MAG TPA: acyl-CoA synthetase FdrA [Casimicrobiaceae bacterium]|nr:acyl-CoA synthetase FdrA [Casimicrobiaceae bacterium]
MTAVVNQVRRTFYRDSVALMRISRVVAALPGVVDAALMIGSTTNKKLMHDAGLLNADGEGASPNDLIFAVRADSEANATSALAEAARLLDAPSASEQGGKRWHPKSLDTALAQLPGANIALISVPGEFAAAEARRALSRGLHVMMFSDNVPLADEVALKQDARARGLLMMGPDCGTSIIGGVPLAFANVIARGDIGIVGASGTGLQEVSTLIARNGRGVSHAIGVGGRDLKEAVGGITTLMAFDALDRDPGTRQIVLISKPPEASVANAVLERIGRSAKKVSICFIGAREMRVPPNAALFADLRSAAENALGGKRIEWQGTPPDASELARRIGKGRTRVRGLFSGGTMSAEAQVFFGRAGMEVTSNVPIPGVRKADGGTKDGNALLDLGDDEYTVGRPHPMIDATLRNRMLAETLTDGRTAVVLLDVVIGHGAHADPAGELVSALPDAQARQAVVITSVCGTEDDPQSYSRQAKTLDDAGVIVAPSNAHAAEVAIDVLRKLVC